MTKEDILDLIKTNKSLSYDENKGILIIPVNRRIRFPISFTIKQIKYYINKEIKISNKIGYNIELL